jgi:hypothetical protein
MLMPAFRDDPARAVLQSDSLPLSASLPRVAMRS